MADDPMEERMRALFREEPDEHLRRLGANLRAQWPPPGDATAAAGHWAARISGAARALEATGQLTQQQARDLELEALAPLIEAGHIAAVDQRARKSGSVESGTPEDDAT